MECPVKVMNYSKLFIVDPLIIKKKNLISFRTLFHKMCRITILSRKFKSVVYCFRQGKIKFSAQDTDLAHFCWAASNILTKSYLWNREKANLPVKNCVQNCKRPCIVRRSLVRPFSSLSAALDRVYLEIKSILKEHSDLFLHMRFHKIFIILFFVFIFHLNFIYSCFADLLFLYSHIQKPDFKATIDIFNTLCQSNQVRAYNRPNV